MSTIINKNAETLATALTAPLSYAIVAQKEGKKDKRVEATFTLENPASGNHITFKVERPKGYRTMLVSMMTGSCNEESFEYVGSMNRGLYIKPAKKEVSANAKEKLSMVRWFMIELSKARKGEGSSAMRVDLHHSGKCTCCGRKLTNPESLATGIGPVCGGRL